MRSGFRDLEIWQESQSLRKDLFDFCREFPAAEKFRLADQLIRASRSVTANIAEGYGRYHYQENIQYLRQARGSLFEIIDHIDVANCCKYINTEVMQNYIDRIEGIIKRVNGYIKYLDSRKQIKK